MYDAIAIGALQLGAMPIAALAWAICSEPCVLTTPECGSPRSSCSGCWLATWCGRHYAADALGKWAVPSDAMLLELGP